MNNNTPITGLSNRPPLQPPAFFALPLGAIRSRGWLGPKEMVRHATAQEDARYDLWGLLLATKVFVQWHDATGDARALTALARAYRKIEGHIDGAPLLNWGQFHWFESLIALDWLFTVDDIPGWPAMGRQCDAPIVDSCREIAAEFKTHPCICLLEPGDKLCRNSGVQIGRERLSQLRRQAAQVNPRLPARVEGRQAVCGLGLLSWELMP